MTSNPSMYRGTHHSLLLGFHKWLRIVKPSTDTDIVFDGILEKDLDPELYLEKETYWYATTSQTI